MVSFFFLFFCLRAIRAAALAAVRRQQHVSWNRITSVLRVVEQQGWGRAAGAVGGEG